MGHHWDKWDIWSGEFTKDVTKQFKISLCTTCMNRLYTLRECLPKNIKDNEDYPNVEFLILDYNSADGLGDWVQKEMMQHIESGKLTYVRTTEPLFYSMTHSRNVAFKAASGDIVNSVDADNFVMPGFVSYVNKLANECPVKAAFAKGKRFMHGRIGFYKNEFIELLGGYDEDIEDYGHDDHDLLRRSMELGFKLMWYGGKYCERIQTPRNKKGEFMKNKDWKLTEDRNKEISQKKLEQKLFKANEGKHWGKAVLVKNFKEEIVI